MKLLRKILDNFEERINHSKKLKHFYPLYEAIDTFLYTPGIKTKGLVHLRDFNNLKRTMTCVIIALLPAVIAALYNTGYQANLVLQQAPELAKNWQSRLFHALAGNFDAGSFFNNIFHGAFYFLPVYFITFITGIFWEILFAVVRKHDVTEGFFVTSLLFPLILPPNIPLWQVAIAISFAIVLAKEVFGGVGMNIFNPALVARAFLFFAYPANISGDGVWIAVDGVSRATPLAQLAENGLQSLSYSFQEAFFGLIPGSMGETSALACLLGAIFLIYTKAGSWRIMLSVVTGAALMSLLFNLAGSSTNPLFAVPFWWHFVTGGFAFGTVYMATDPVSAAQTNTGQYWYGLLIGMLVILVRVVNPAFPEGMMLAILFGNMTAPLIDYFVLNANIKLRRNLYEK